MIFGSRKVKDVSLWQLRLVAFLATIKSLPLTIKLSYYEYYNELLKARRK